jgi:hypothetical protein
LLGAFARLGPGQVLFPLHAARTLQVCATQRLGRRLVAPALVGRWLAMRRMVGWMATAVGATGRRLPLATGAMTMPLLICRSHCASLLAM